MSVGPLGAGASRVYGGDGRTRALWTVAEEIFGKGKGYRWRELVQFNLKNSPEVQRNPRLQKLLTQMMLPGEAGEAAARLMPLAFEKWFLVPVQREPAKEQTAKVEPAAVTPDSKDKFVRARRVATPPPPPPPNALPGKADAQAVTRSGPGASVQVAGVTLKGSIAQADLKAGKLIAAFSLLAGANPSNNQPNARFIQTDGSLTVMWNPPPGGGLTQAKFEAALKAALGVTSVNGTATIEKSAAGAQWNTALDFLNVRDGFKVSAQNTLSLTATGQAVDTAKLAAKKYFGPNTSVSFDNTLVFTNGALSHDQLNAALETAGLGGVIEGTLQATYDNGAIRTLRSVAAFKATLGNNVTVTPPGVFDANVGATIARNANGSLSPQEFDAAMKALFGEGAQTVDGTYRWTRTATGGTQQEIVADYINNRSHFSVNQDVVVGDGSANLSAHVKSQFGPYVTLDANNQLILTHGQITSDRLNTELAAIGAAGSIKTTLALSDQAGQAADAAIRVQAFRDLKVLQGQGDLTLKTDDSVDIANGAVDRSTVAALLSLVAGPGKVVNIETSGKLVLSGGAWQKDFLANLHATWGATTVVDSQLHYAGGGTFDANVKALFNLPGNVTTNLNAVINGATQDVVDFQLAHSGTGASINSAGHIEFDQLKLSALSLTTNLVTSSTQLGNLSGTGVLNYSHTADASSLGTQVNGTLNKGALDISLGVSAHATAAVYHPDATDPIRQRMETQGVVWGIRQSQLDVQGGAGFQGTLPGGTVSIQFGLSGRADKGTTVSLLTRNPSADAATKLDPFVLFRASHDVQANSATMQAGEQVAWAGTHTLGFEGNLGATLGLGPAGVSVTGSAQWALNGQFQVSQIKETDGTTTLRTVVQSNDVKVLAVGVKLGLTQIPTLPGLPAIGSTAVQAVGNKFLGALQASIQHQVSNLKQGDELLNANVDFTKPGGLVDGKQVSVKEAVAEWSGGAPPVKLRALALIPGSGVTLGTDIKVDLTMKSSKTDLDFFNRTHENLDQDIAEAIDSLTPLQQQLEDKVVVESHVRRPWAIHHLTEQNLAQLTYEIEQPRAATTGVTNAAAEPMVKAAFGARIEVSGPQTSKKDVDDLMDRSLAVLKAVHMPPDTYQPFVLFRGMMRTMAPPDKPLFTIPVVKWSFGDKSMGAVDMLLKGTIGPGAWKGILLDKNGQPRSASDLQRATLDAEGLVGKKAPVFSLTGVQAAIERTLKAKLLPTANGFDVIRNDATGVRLGTLTAADLETLRTQLLQQARPASGSALSFASQQGTPGSETATTIGTWIGTPPKALMVVDSGMWSSGADALKRSAQFGAEGERCANLFKVNQPPEGAVNDPAYQAAYAAWKKTAKPPDEYMTEIVGSFQNAVKEDASRVVMPATMMTLADETGIAAEVDMTVPPETINVMLTTGKNNVSFFAALSMAVVGLGDGKRHALLDAQHNLIVSPAPDPATWSQIIAGLQGMFPGITSATVGVQGSVNSKGVIGGLKFPSNAFRDNLAAFLNAVTVDPKTRQMKLPPDWSQAKASQAVAGFLGASGAVDASNGVLFDNTTYGAISISSILQDLGRPPVFFVDPKLTYSPNAIDRSGHLIMAHQGVNSTFGKDPSGRPITFMNLGSLDRDPSQAPPLADLSGNSWIMPLQ